MNKWVMKRGEINNINTFSFDVPSHLVSQEPSCLPNIMSTPFNALEIIHNYLEFA